MRTSRVLGALLIGGLFAATPTPAQAYVRSRATSCKAVYWAQTCVYIQADSNYVKDMLPADIEKAIQSSINAWQSRTVPGGFLTLKYLPADGVKETTYKDGLQLIKFRPDTWAYDASATAITTVSYINKAGDSQDGQIVDADIELNAVNNLFFDADKGPPSSTDQRNPADLWNTLTHEIGHLQGLDHTCRSSSESATDCSVDDTGASRPLCSLVARQRTTNATFKAIYETTMYAVADPAETRKRIPQADDVKGITASYPAASDPKSCSLPGAMTSNVGGCTTSATQQPASRAGQALALAGVALTVGLVARRRRRTTLV